MPSLHEKQEAMRLKFMERIAGRPRRAKRTSARSAEAYRSDMQNIRGNDAVSWAIGRPDLEAKEIARWVSLGVETVESARILIGIPEKIIEQWASCDDPLLLKQLMVVKRYREEVLEYFNRIIAKREAVAA